MQNPLLKKLQIKPGYTVKIDGAPVDASSIFGEIPGDISFEYGNAPVFDALICFALSKKDLSSQVERYLNSIKPGSIIWIVYPKKSSKIKSDLDLMNTWQDLDLHGLTPCASASIDTTWTGLRLKPLSEVKTSNVGNAQIKHNEFADFIDVDKKTVTLPADFKAAISIYPDALQFFSQLSYSNKKEYVLWILTAKQEKTRLTRVEKAIKMLLNSKKNPSSKD
ncbi:YdeI/OmpD-associated family protein [Pedobacter nototheniae]|uniref:YdeI/OmpD-associated family protein n=1 Tax=Pedobacter nototheniae TaxID=2488994 RepID=UPI00293022A3|nr:YdeI/OmpD-associated family protein [Pedobacter nototheniae]